MRALLRAKLSCAYQTRDNKLVVGLRPAAERVALFVFLAGLFLIGLPLALMTDGREVPAGAFVPGAIMALIGFFVLYAQPRLIFDRQLGRLCLVRLLRRNRYWEFQEIERIEVLRAFEIEDMKLVLKNGERLLVFHGSSDQTRVVADKIAAFLQIPLERKNLTPFPKFKV